VIRTHVETHGKNKQLNKHFKTHSKKIQVSAYLDMVQLAASWFLPLRSYPLDPLATESEYAGHPVERMEATSSQRAGVLAAMASAPAAFSNLKRCLLLRNKHQRLPPKSSRHNIN
jgi:hypothetical protein